MASSFAAFNRTSVELKLSPKRNIKSGNGTFNRTSVELKHSVDVVNLEDFLPFNRTSVELKPLIGKVFARRQGCF